jgi:hypothetical protein
MIAGGVEPYRQGLGFPGGTLDITGTGENQHRRPLCAAFKDIGVQGRTEIVGPLGTGLFARIGKTFPQIHGKTKHHDLRYLSVFERYMAKIPIISIY